LKTFHFLFFLNASTRKKKSKFFFLQRVMWWGVICGMLVALAKIVFDMVRGVGTPTVHLQKDRHLWSLLRTHRMSPDIVRDLDALVGAFLNGESFDGTALRAKLANEPEPLRRASEELLAKCHNVL
jgi:hypothetical protein